MARWMPPPEYRPTPEMQAERDLNQRHPSHRFSPGAKYYPAKTVIEAPLLENGDLDVRELLRRLDKACNDAVP